MNTQETNNAMPPELAELGIDFKRTSLKTWIALDWRHESFPANWFATVTASRTGNGGWHLTASLYGDAGEYASASIVRHTPAAALAVALRMLEAGKP